MPSSKGTPTTQLGIPGSWMSIGVGDCDIPAPGITRFPFGCWYVNPNLLIDIFCEVDFAWWVLIGVGGDIEVVEMDAGGLSFGENSVGGDRSGVQAPMIMEINTRTDEVSILEGFMK